MNTEEGGSGSAITAQFTMPWFMGAAFIPKFNGQTNKFDQWRAQVTAMLRAQGLNRQQEVDFVLEALEGDAKREMHLVDSREKDTSEKIFQLLQSMYAKPVSKSQLRSTFFNCKQKVDETVDAFILRLRELFYKWQEQDEEGAADDNNLLLDQLMGGLKRGQIKQELNRQLRRQNRMTFKEACREARALAQEFQEEEEEVLSNRVQYTPHRPTAPNPEQLKTQIKAELKEELLGEIKTEIKEQLKSLSSELVSEIRAQFSTHNPPALTPPTYARPRSHSTNNPYQWDAEGRPICVSCGVAGHLQRRCPQKSARSQDF